MPARAVTARGVGSSQIAALVGLAAYSDILDVYNEIVLGVHRKVPYSAWSHEQEDAILAARARQLTGNGKSGGPWIEKNYRDNFGERWLGGTTVRAAESKIALASPDALFYLECGDTEQVEEAKAVGYHESWNWGDEDEQTPVGYRLQNLWQQGCTGIHRGEIVASIAGAEPAGWAVAWDQALYENLLIVAEAFWRDNVLTGKPPRPVDGSAAATAYVWARYPAETQPLERASAAIEELALKFEAVRALRKTAESDEATLENRLCDAIGDRLGYQLSDGRRVTWKAQKTAHGGTTRVLRLPERKGAKT